MIHASHEIQCNKYCMILLYEIQCYKYCMRCNATNTAWSTLLMRYSVTNTAWSFCVRYNVTNTAWSTLRMRYSVTNPAWDTMLQILHDPHFSWDTELHIMHGIQCYKYIGNPLNKLVFQIFKVPTSHEMQYWKYLWSSFCLINSVQIHVLNDLVHYKMLTSHQMVLQIPWSPPPPPPRRYVHSVFSPNIVTSKAENSLYITTGRMQDRSSKWLA